jgi:hypothetical protein
VVTKIKREDFKDLQSLQENITKKDECDDGTPLKFSDATVFMCNDEEPSKMQVQNSYCDIEPFHSATIRKKEVQHRVIMHFACL